MLSSPRGVGSRCIEPVSASDSDLRRGVFAAAFGGSAPLPVFAAFAALGALFAALPVPDFVAALGRAAESGFAARVRGVDVRLVSLVLIVSVLSIEAPGLPLRRVPTIVMVPAGTGFDLNQQKPGSRRGSSRPHPDYDRAGL